MSCGTPLRCQREQVAAVCYRIRGRDIEFLLVRSRSGRWIFPKGSIAAGLTRAQSAALEAFEEAGVRGRIETIAFSRYIRRRTTRCCGASTVVHTYLCEVRELIAPQESNRNRTWLSSSKAKRRLQQKRTSASGEELAGVVDRAVARIKRLQAGNSHRRLRDALQHSQLEACQYAGPFSPASARALLRYFRGQPLATHSATRVISPQSFRQAQLQLGSGLRTPNNRKK